MDAAVERYKFLWDTTSMTDRIEKNEIWPHIVASLPHMRRRYGSADTAWDQHVAILQAISITLAERLRELAGVVQLAHSQYYSNAAVIGAIASFIATGKFPEEAFRPTNVTGSD